MSSDWLVVDMKLFRSHKSYWCSKYTTAWEG